MSGAGNLRRKVIRGITRKEVTTAIGVLLIAVIVICVVIIVVTLLRNYEPGPRPKRYNYPTSRHSVIPTRPTPYYKNCREAHADGRWDIPQGDPAYRPALDGDRNGIACESPKSRRAGR